MRVIDIFGVKFAVVNYESATKKIIHHARNCLPYTVFALPVHGIIEARNDAEFKRATDSASLIVPDGQPIKWIMNYFHNAKMADRVYGPKLVESILKEADAFKLKVFLYGGKTQQILDDFQCYIESNYPNVTVCGAYREVNINDISFTLESLKDQHVDIVLCGLGCPIQEKWIAKQQHFFQGVIMGVGAAFSFHSGHLKMAPHYLQAIGLEWLYRLIKEPRRLWRRYLYTNTYFIILTIRYVISRRYIRN